MFCSLTASTARALLCMADVDFQIQVMVEAVVACPEPEHCHLFPSGFKWPCVQDQGGPKVGRISDAINTLKKYGFTQRKTTATTTNTTTTCAMHWWTFRV